MPWDTLDNSHMSCLHDTYSMDYMASEISLRCQRTCKHPQGKAIPLPVFLTSLIYSAPVVVYMCTRLQVSIRQENAHEPY